MYITSCHLLSFRGSLQDYKIQLGMELQVTVLSLNPEFTEHGYPGNESTILFSSHLY